MMKKARPLIITGALMVFFVWLQFFLSVSGVVSGKMHGFDIDAKERLYVGVGKQINVYTDGELTYVIRPVLPEPYRFFIQDDTLVIGYQNGRATRVFDLAGNYLSESELSFKDVRKRAETNKFAEHFGKEYSYEDHFGLKPAEIRCNGDVLYRMSWLDFLFTGVPFFAILAVLAVCFTFSLLLLLSDEEARDHFKAIRKI